MMDAREVKAFLRGRIHAFDPATGDRVATVDYGAGGACRLTFASGQSEAGAYGFEGDTYWTRYERFRGGQRNGFRLERVSDSVAQAWNTNGSRAFLQSPLETLPTGTVSRG